MGWETPGQSLHKCWETFETELNWQAIFSCHFNNKILRVLPGALPVLSVPRHSHLASALRYSYLTACLRALPGGLLSSGPSFWSDAIVLLKTMLLSMWHVRAGDLIWLIHSIYLKWQYCAVDFMENAAFHLQKSERHRMGAEPQTPVHPFYWHD